MSNLLITIVVGIGIAVVIGGSALSVFQSARDNYDQQMLWIKMEQTVAALKSKARIIDGLPALPMANVTGSYPAVPGWVTGNAVDAQGHAFVYCPYAIRPTSNLEGTSTSVTGPGYSVVTYGSTLMDASSDTYVIGSAKPTLAGTTTAAPLGLIGYVISFKQHDAYNATSAAAWCNEITVSSTGQLTTNDATVNGIVYPVVMGQSNYQQAMAKSDLVTLYVGTAAAGDGTGRNPANQTTINAAFAQLAALKPLHAKLWVTSGALTLTNNSRTTTTSPAATLTPSAVTGNNVTFTAGSAVFSAGNVGQEIISSAGRATIISETSTTVVKAVVTQDFASTSAISSGSWSLATDTAVYDKTNLRGMIVDMQGAGSGSTTLTLSTDLDLPVNMILRAMTVSSGNNFIRVRPGTQWIINNSIVSNVTVDNGELWVNGTSQINAASASTTALKITDGGRMVVNGTLTTTTPNLGVDIQPGRVDILPGASWTVTASTLTGTPIAPIIVRAGGKLSVSGTAQATAGLTVTSSGVALNGAINVVPGGAVYLNNAAISFNTGTGSIAGDRGVAVNGSAAGAPGVIVDGGEVYLNNGALQFPSGVASGVAAVTLVDGGKFYMQGNSLIGSVGTSSARPYYGIYDNGGSFVGGDSTGYTSGANGEGGDAQSNIYVAVAAGSACWAGNPLPTSPASGTVVQQRQLFMDSNEGPSATSAPRNTNTGGGTVAAGKIDYRHLMLSNHSNWACNGVATTTLANLTPSSFSFTNVANWCTTPSPQTSGIIRPTGFNNGVSVSISGTAGTSPQYSIDGNAYQSTTMTCPCYSGLGGSCAATNYCYRGNPLGVTNCDTTHCLFPGDNIQLEVTPSTTNSSVASTSLVLGSTTGTAWTVTTTSTCSGGGGPTSYSIVQTVWGHATSSTTVNATPSSTTSGNFILVVATATGSTFPTISDNKGDTYSTAYTYTNSEGAQGIYYIPSNGGGITSVTATYAGAQTGNLMAVREYNLNSTLSAVDVKAEAQGSSNPQSSGNTGAIAQADELVIGVAVTIGGASPNYTAGTGYGNLTTQSYDFTGPVSLYVGIEDKLTNAIAAQAATIANPNGDTIDIGVATFH